MKAATYPTKEGGLVPRSFDLRLLVFLTALIFAVGCGKKKSSSTVFPQDKPTCSTSAIPDQFIVYWEDGSRSVHKGVSRETLLTTLVEPHLEKIKRVDYDRKIQIQPLTSTDEASPSYDGGLWGIEVTEAYNAWKIGVEGESALVAVIDTGVAFDHPQLINQIAYNVGEEGLDAEGNDKRSNLKDDDENGYVDDFIGFNFLYDDGVPDDSGFHGSHVAGIVAAEHTQNPEVPLGVAPKAKLIPIAFINDSGGELSDALDSIDYAIKRGAHIINASWGALPCAPGLGEKIASLKKEDVLFVAAAGNSGINIELNPEFPAAFESDAQITVGSISKFLGMAGHSNYGSNLVNIFAPGVDILSTIKIKISEPDEYLLETELSGTSMATPFVSGALALLKSYRPQAKSAELKEALLKSVDKDRDYENSTHGRLNICKALKRIKKLVPEAPPSPHFDAPHCEEDEE